MKLNDAIRVTHRKRMKYARPMLPWKLKRRNES